MKYKIEDLLKNHDNRCAVPDIIHFVWIGDTNKVFKDYIEIWKRTNKGKEIYFWCDQETSSCISFHESIRNHIIENQFEDPTKKEVEIKNDAFRYIFPRVIQGDSFNVCVSDFLTINNIKHNIKSSHLNSWFDKHDIIVKSINDLFNEEKLDYKRFYYYEIILRGNLASASDIIRLLILHIIGGVYIDIDTLPSLEANFLNLDKLVNKNNYKKDDYLIMFKTKKILDRLSLYTCQNKDYFEYYKNDDCILHHKIISAIERDVSDFSIDKILPLGALCVQKNLLSIGAVERLKGAYFNNFMFTHAKSKAVSLILRTMRKRYVYLEKKDYIFNLYKGGESENYLSRILPWRGELILKNFGVTSIVTGPGLIIEVMLGIAYELLDLKSFETPATVANYMHNEKFGIASFRHNLDTPKGVDSSWRR